MGLFDFLFKKKPIVETAQKETASQDEVVVKVTVPTIKKNPMRNYKNEIVNIRSYFGELSKSVDFSEIEKFRTLRIQIPAGVYYGYTRYTGETNRNGVKAVAFDTQIESLSVILDRKLWKQYDNKIGVEGLKWVGYSDGMDFEAIVYKCQVQEERVTDFLYNVGEWIGYNEFSNMVLEKAKLLNLPDGEFIYNKAATGKGYDFYYNGKYQVAGIQRYVAEPFVSFGFAKLEPENSFNNKAVAVYTDTNQKIGYISEKELSKFYTETGGIDNIPLVIEGHFYEGRLYGWLYTFSRNQEEYHYMVNQYLKEYERQYH